MSESLKPCKCGGKAKLFRGRVAEDSMEAFVECAKCGATTDRFEDAYAPTLEAIDAWNRGANITGGHQP